MYLAFPRDWGTILASDDYAFADVAENVEGVRGFVFGRPLHRHVLFSAVAHPLYRLGMVVAPARAMALPTALFAALSVGMIGTLARESARGMGPALLCAGTAAISASHLIYAGVPETYVPLGSLVLLTAWVWRRTTRGLGWWPALLVGLALTGLMNPLAFLLLGLVLVCCTPKPSLGRTLAATLIAGLVVEATRWAVLSSTMPGHTWPELARSSARYLASYGSLAHLGDFRSLWTVLAETLVGSILRTGLSTPRPWPWALPVLLACALLGAGCARAPSRPWALFVVSHMAFFLWFNPRESLLYAPATLGPWLLCLLELTSRRRWGLWCWVFLLALAAATNAWLARGLTRP